MRKVIASFATTALLLLSMSATADVAQVWQCQLAEGTTNDDAMTLSKAWLDAAKGISADARVRVYFPIAANADTGSFIFAFYLPNFKSWGEFTDAYPGSPVAQIDATWDDTAPCEQVSGLWWSQDIE